MIDETKKIVGGGQPSELTGKALDESALDAVSGGKSKESLEWSKSAWEWVKGLYTGDEDKEQQP